MDIISVIITTAKVVGVTPGLMLAVCIQESGLKDTHNYNDGGSASYGPCQVKKGTAIGMGKEFGNKEMEKWTSEDMHDTKNNIKAATMYLSYNLTKYNGNTCAALAAYNAGKVTESDKEKGLPRNYKYVKNVAFIMGYKNIGNECRAFFKKRNEKK